MKTSLSKRFPRFLSAAACLVFAPLLLLLCASAEGRSWTSVQSENFVVVSDAGAAEARNAAVRLEELRAIFSRLQAQDGFDVSIPVTVMLFQNEGDYEFFKPVYGGDLRRDVAGYFQYSPDVNYIALSLSGSGHDPLTVLFHEYIHALVRNNYAGAPIWFNEGLAQYYSEFELAADRRRVHVGRALTHRLDALARGQLLPLGTLLSVDVTSAHYQQPDKHALFYAQSWAFVHYLLSDPRGVRQAQLARYLELASGDASVEENFREAFKVGFGQMEIALAAYVRAGHYRERSESFAAPVPLATAKLSSRALTDAEAQAALGDLLLHTNRPEDAEEYLARALKLDAKLAPAHSSLGLMRLQQNRFGEAREHLERAVEGAPENHLAHFYYAELLRNEGLETEKTVTGYAATTRLIRAELKKAIELAPNFLAAYALLGRVDLERSPRVDETFALLGHAATLAPRRQEFKLLLAQLHARRAEFERARQMLEPLARDRRSAQTRAEAQTLLEKVKTSVELAAAQRKAQSITPGDATNALAANNEGAASAGAASVSTGGAGEASVSTGGATATSGAPAALPTSGAPPASPRAEVAAQAAGAASAETTAPAAEETQPCDMPQPGPQFKPLRFDGRQVCGQLVSVECEDATGVTLLVETPHGTLKLRSAALNRIRFVSYTADVRGRVECGLRTRSNPVLVTYRPLPDARVADGEVIAVEFVPPDWVH
jgi:tetratricopeptide (TPR) repeat protein